MRIIVWCMTCHPRHPCHASSHTHLSQIFFEDKLRLVLLYSLRYERHKESQRAEFIQLLQTSATTHDQHARLAVIDVIMTQCGYDIRKDKGALFGDGMVARLDSFVKGLTGGNSENVYQQHKPLMFDVLVSGAQAHITEHETCV